MGKRPSPNVKVLANQRLVRSLIIAKYGKNAADDQDLFQAGLVGLCLAVDSYKANKVTGRFSSYARTCIISELAKCSLASGHRILPHRRFYERIEIQRHVQSLASVLGRDPTTPEILESWEGSRPPTTAAIERALQPDPVLVVVAISDGDSNDREFANYSPDPDTIEIEDLIDAKRRFERLDPEEQALLTRGHRG